MKEGGEPACGRRAIERQEDRVEDRVEEERERTDHDHDLEGDHEGKDDRAPCRETPPRTCVRLLGPALSLFRGDGRFHCRLLVMRGREPSHDGGCRGGKAWCQESRWWRAIHESRSFAA